MKWWFNAAAVSVCVLLAFGGCQKSAAKNQETATSIKEEVNNPPKAAIQEAALDKAAPAASAAPTPPAVPTPSASAQAPKPAGEQPKIKFENTVYDLNDVKPDSKNLAKYTFTNVGKVNLKIVDIQKTCGCTPFELTKREYAPGESGTIKVEYQASKVGGQVLKHLIVMTDDPNNSRVELVLKANIVVPVEAEPRTMQLSLEAPNANAPDVSVYSLKNKPFSITSVESTNNTITADVDPNASAAKFVVKLKVDMEKLKSNLNGFIKFHLANANIDEASVTYTTLPEFELQPAAIILRSATPKQAETRELWVKNNYNKPFEIESVSSKNGYIKLLKEEKLENMYKLTVQITAPELQKLMFFNDTLTIKIKNGKALEVVCRGFFKRAK